MNMNGLNQSSIMNSAVNALKEEKVKRSEKGKDAELNKVGGRTIGEPKLSDKALKYYEQLKKKYSNMDFILISPEQKEEAESKKGTYSSSKELIVLIDSDKIERMAEDEAYRNKYETILSDATAQLEQMKSSLGANADRVSAFGVSFDDNGNASFFAVVDKSLAVQRERIAAKREENIKAKKQEEKRAEKKRTDDQFEKKLEKKRTEAGGKVTVTAGSWDELLKKIDDIAMADKADNMLTEAELKLGQNIDFSL